MESSIIQKILTNIKIHIPSWSVLEPTQISIKSLPACSNLIYQVQIIFPSLQITPNILIYRQFGRSDKKETPFIDPQTERQVFQQLGVKSYGISSCYRLEEFLIDYRMPNNPEMLQSSFLQTVTKEISNLHFLKIDLKSKTPIMETFLNNTNRIFEKAFEVLTKNNGINTNIEENTKINENQKKKELKEFFCNGEEVKFLLEILPKNKESIVFCHNDLNPSNIFLKKCNNDIEIKFIDWEYAGFNYRGFEFASFFIEIAFDYSEFPIYTYREEMMAKEEKIKEFCRFYAFHHNIEVINIEEFIEGLVKEIKVGVLQWLFYSGIWNVLMFDGEKIEFDYLGMAWDKFMLYRNYKKENFSLN